MSVATPISSTAADKIIPLTGTTGLGSHSFSAKVWKRPVSIESDFVLYEVDGFAGGDVSTFGMTDASGSGTLSYPRGEINFTNGTRVLYLPENLTHPWSVISVDVLAFGAGVTNDTIQVGIHRRAASPNDALFVEYNDVTKAISIQKLVAGVLTSIASGTVDGTPTRIHFVCNGRFVSAWTTGSLGVTSPKVWLTKNVSAVFDLRTDANCAAFAPMLVLIQESGKTIRIGKIKHTIMGATGNANHTLVRYKDGTPMTQDGKYFFTCTLPGYGDNGDGYDFTSFHSAVFSYDPTSHKYTETAKLFNHRSSAVTSDHVYCLVYDPESSTWEVTASTFGNYDTNGQVAAVKYYTTKSDILHGITTFEPGNSLGVTLGDGIYDCTFVVIAGTYYVVYARYISGVFHPCVATGTGLGSLTEQVQGSLNAEGPKICKVGGKWYYTCYKVSDSTLHYFDLITGGGQTIGTDNGAVTQTGYYNPAGIQAHACILEWRKADATTGYQMINFFNDVVRNRTGGSIGWTQGGNVIQESDTTNAGWEHPVRTYDW